MNAPLSTETQLTKLGTERFNIPAILRMLDQEAKEAYGGSERTQIELVARLVRAQQAEIARLRDGFDWLAGGSVPETGMCLFARRILEAQS